MSRLKTIQYVGEIVSQFGTLERYSILDLGCRTGDYWKNAISSFVYVSITGVDLRSDDDLLQEFHCSFNQTMNDIKNSEHKSLLDFDFIQLDIREFVERSSDTYDLVVCFQILSLLEKEDAYKLLSNFKTILNKNGLIALCIPSDNFKINKLTELPPQFPENDRNKFNLSDNEFFEFVNEYEMKYYFKDNLERNSYHWAVLSCT